MWKIKCENVCKVFDWLLPQEILRQEIKKDHSKRRALLQARAVVTVTVSAFFALVTQLFLDTYSSLRFHEQSSSEIIREITVLLFTWQVAYEQEFAVNQDNMQRSLDEARSAATAKSMFISNVSHGKNYERLVKKLLSVINYCSCLVLSFNIIYNTFHGVALRLKPLHGILATVEILGKTKLNESQRALLNAIESCGTNLISVVNQVLTFAKIEHGKIELENNVFDVFTLIQEIGDGLAPIPERKRLDFIVFSKVNPLHRFMIGDVGCLRQIILNLLGNAIKFTDRGKIKLNITELSPDDELNTGDEQQKKEVTKKLKATTSDGKNIEDTWEKVRIRIEVADTGRGIAPDFLAHMYQPFSQEDSSLRRKFEGTGLGLSIVKGLLDMMNSRLEVKSDTKGSNFSFCLTLPISPTFEDMCATSLPFSHDHLKISAHKQEELIAKLRSLSFVILNRSNFLLLQRITEYFTEWELNYRLVEKENMKIECSKENCDIIILNDNIADLQWFLNEFNTQQQPTITATSNGIASTAAARTKPVTAIGTPNTSLRERQGQLTSTKTAMLPNQCVMIFSTIAEYHKAETILKKFKPRSAVVVSKPGGPVKIFTAAIKAMESICPQRTVATTCSSPSDSNNMILRTTDEKQNELLEQPFSSSIFGSAARSTPNVSSQEIHELQFEEQLLPPPLIKDEEPMRKKKQEEGVVDIVGEEGDEKVKKSKKLLEEGAKEKTGQDKFSFLVVEDNKVNAMILTTMLKQAHYKNYDLANNGLEAVEKFAQKDYDIIFMDLQMPICDGIEATKEIRKIERGESSHLLLPTHTTTIEHQPPSVAEACHDNFLGRTQITQAASTMKRRKKAIIIAMTGLASQEDSNVAEQAGCNEFLTKPVSIKTLHSRMEEWTREALKRQHEEAAQESALLEENQKEALSPSLLYSSHAEQHLQNLLRAARMQPLSSATTTHVSIPKERKWEEKFKDAGGRRSSLSLAKTRSTSYPGVVNTSRYCSGDWNVF
ncbi:4568_t:CDS:10 [Ambispora leptoticha]|uniref:4568_t:CDS:1 n=1 Tax=Ambispora leptoticha TaxID=144679 RepID=A0A9N8ZG28_9GLOM|nr:4568_t:CDS:10 [Ambispora leptoticha]